MTTLLPQSTAGAPGPPPRARRGRRLLLGVTGVLVAALVAAGVWVLTYQPLVSGTVAGIQTDADTDVVEASNFFGHEYTVVAPEPGDTISMWLELGNDGPLGVTIVEVAQPFNPDGAVDPTFSSEATGPGRVELTVYRSGQQVPVSEPFALAPGMSDELRLSFDVADCATVPGQEGSSGTATTVPVTYRVLGLTRTVDLEFGYALSIEAEPRCPMP